MHTTPFHLHGTRERGVVLVLVLVVLAAMGLAVVGLMRTVDASTIATNNLAFKDWAAHAAELGVARAAGDFTAGPLATTAALEADLVAANYAAAALPVDAQGVPQVLLNSSGFDSAYPSATTRIVFPTGETVRYLIERLCAQPGPASEASCLTTSTSERGGSQPAAKTGTDFSALYRITVRVDGVRNTLHFSQVIFRPV